MYSLLHRGTFLRAHAVIEEVLARQTVTLLRSGATTGAKKVAALPWIASKTTTLPALWRAVGLGESLTILGTFTPTPLLAAFITLWTGPFRRREVVDVNVLCPAASYYLIPVYGRHVAEVVVVIHTDATIQNVCETINKRTVIADENYFSMH